MDNNQKTPSWEYLSRLRQLVANSFNLDELRTLCFDIGVNYENLAGEGNESKSRSLIEYLLRRDELFKLINYCSKVRPNLSWHEAPDRELLESKLKDTLSSHDIAEVIEIFKDTEYSDEFLVWFMTNQGIPSNYRLKSLYAYIESGRRNDSMFIRLLGDFDQDMRLTMLRNIASHGFQIDESAIGRLLTDPLSNRNVILETVRLASERVKQRKLSANILVSEQIVKYPYFKIHLHAIEALIDTNLAESVELLGHFSDTTYHVARRRICDHFETLFNNGKLEGLNLTKAIELLDKFITDGKSSQTAQERMIVLRAKLSGNNRA